MVSKIRVNYKKLPIETINNMLPIGSRKTILEITGGTRQTLCTTRCKCGNIQLQVPVGNLICGQNIECRECQANKYRIGTVLPFLKDDILSFYLMGTALSDGSFFKEKYGIYYSFKVADKDWIDKLAPIFHANISSYQPKTKPIMGRIPKNKAKIIHAIKIGDKKNIPIIMDKFGLSFNKTYNPPNLTCWNHFNEESLLSILLGMIDGDGSINQDYRVIHVKQHQSWYPIHLFFKDLLCKHNCTVNQQTEIIEGKEYYLSNLYIPRTGYLVINDIIKKYSPPILDRKWNMNG